MRPPILAMIASLAALTKIPIALASTLTSATGYIVFTRGLRVGALAAAGAVLALAAGACALNQWQERRLDAKMRRTRGRPIPSGEISAGMALGVALALILVGLGLLLIAGNITATLLGLAAVAWYNGLYTPLKRVTAFAVVPGALIGALPPAIGWTAAGGSPLDPRILCLSFLFFIWQVPHFWLLLFLHGDDYGQAGLPTLTRLFGRTRLARLTFIWMLFTAASCLLLPIYGLSSSRLLNIGLLLCALYLGWTAAGILRAAGEPRAMGLAFRRINLFALAVMVLLCVDPYLGLP